MDMPNNKVFTIPKNLLPESLPNPNSWETYDEECSRAEIKLNDDVLDKILSLSETGLLRQGGKYTIHRVKYYLDGDTPEYTINEHQDNCRFTLIIYLDKSPGIRDEFWVGDRKITQNVWSKNKNRYKGLVFWGNVPHRGKILGKGKRNILCFFCD